MANAPDFDAATILKRGTTIATGAASVSTAIPTNAAGTPARYVRISVTQAAYVAFGKTTATAAAGDILVNPSDAVNLCVTPGNDTVAAIQVSVAGIVQISPIEW